MQINLCIGDLHKLDSTTTFTKPPTWTKGCTLDDFRGKLSLWFSILLSYLCGTTQTPTMHSFRLDRDTRRISERILHVNLIVRCKWNETKSCKVCLLMLKTIEKGNFSCYVRWQTIWSDIDDIANKMISEIARNEKLTLIILIFSPNILVLWSSFCATSVNTYENRTSAALQKRVGCWNISNVLEPSCFRNLKAQRNWHTRQCLGLLESV